MEERNLSAGPASTTAKKTAFDLTDRPGLTYFTCTQTVTLMATKQNITVAIDSALLKKARAIAARRGLSVSALLADELRELVAEDTQYSTARKRALALLSTPLRLGGAPLKRDELHERSRIR